MYDRADENPYNRNTFRYIFITIRRQRDQRYSLNVLPHQLIKDKSYL